MFGTQYVSCVYRLPAKIAENGEQQNKSIPSKSHRVSLNNRKIKQFFLVFRLLHTWRSTLISRYEQTHTHTYSHVATGMSIVSYCWRRIFSLWHTHKDTLQKNEMSNVHGPRWEYNVSISMRFECDCQYRNAFHEN